MKQFLFIVALLSATASAHLPTEPKGVNATITNSRALGNPMGPNTRRLYFKNSATCNSVFNTWALSYLDNGASYCWFTQYCNIDPNSGYTGLPYLFISHPSHMVRCGINGNGIPSNAVGFIQLQQYGFSATSASTSQPSVCLSTSVGNKPSGFHGVWQDHPGCEDGHHCHECTEDRIDGIEFHFQ